MSEILSYLENIRALDLNENQNIYFDFLIENGVLFTEKLPYYHVKKFEVKERQCFRNSILTAINCNFEYYEGFYFTDVKIVIEHAFNRIFDNAKVIDVTAEKFNISVFEWFGVEVPQNILNEFLRSKYNGVLSPLQYYFRFHINK